MGVFFSENLMLVAGHKKEIYQQLHFYFKGRKHMQEEICKK